MGTIIRIFGILILMAMALETKMKKPMEPIPKMQTVSQLKIPMEIKYQINMN
jgi:hypothetical protein